MSNTHRVFAVLQSPKSFQICFRSLTAFLQDKKFIIIIIIIQNIGVD